MKKLITFIATVWFAAIFVPAYAQGTMDSGKDDHMKGGMSGDHMDKDNMGKKDKMGKGKMNKDKMGKEKMDKMDKMDK